MRSLIFVYDFDGTLTPYSSPQYKILKDCGYDDIKMDELVRFFTSKGFDLHEAFLEAVYDIFKRFDVPLRIETFCEGAQDIEFNKGILEFFNKFKRDNIRHYVVSSGFRDVISKSKVSEFLDDIYGINVLSDENKFEIINFMKEQDKVKAIDEIVRINNCQLSDVVYFGDGLTDRCAFSHVHNNGGISVLVKAQNSDLFNDLAKESFIDFAFLPDYSQGSDIDRFVERRVREL
jgi:phosphoserine phosphatase